MNERPMDTRHRRARTSRCAKGARSLVGEREIALFNLGDRFLAIDNRCPHKGGPLVRRHRRRRRGGLSAARVEGQPARPARSSGRRGEGPLRAHLSDARRGRRRARSSCRSRRRGRRRGPGGMTRAATGFLRSGHPPTLVAALLYFDVSFMAWVLLGPLAPFLREELGLSATQTGPAHRDSAARRVAVPAGARPARRPHRRTPHRPDRPGADAGAAGARPGSWRSTVAHFYALGLLLGIAGASFAVALPLASRWYPPQYQGLAMGIAGAGNSGTLLATLFAPRLAERFGWAATFGLAMLPVVARARSCSRCWRKDSPTPRTAAGAGATTRAVLSERDTFWLSFLYSLTFGGFVGFASFLTTFFHEQYQVSRVGAGDFTTLVVVAGSLLRPVGGWLSDRIGGYRLLVLLLAAFAAVPRRRGDAAAARRRGRAAVRRHGAAGHGQRRGLPAGAAALPRAHRHRHRHRRRRGRARRLLPAVAARRGQGRDRRLSHGPARLRWRVRGRHCWCCSSSARAGRSGGRRRRDGRRRRSYRAYRASRWRYTMQSILCPGKPDSTQT